MATIAAVLIAHACFLTKRLNYLTISVHEEIIMKSRHGYSHFRHFKKAQLMTVRSIFILLILTVVNLHMVACAFRETPTAEPLRALNIKKLLVVPFNKAFERYEAGSTVRCPLCGAVFVTGPVPKGVDRYMTRQLLAYLKDKTTYTLISPGPGAAVRSNLLFESADLSEREVLIEMGQRLKADAVVSGTVYRFRQRVGTGFSVSTPASVAFGIHLLRVADERMVWVGRLDETQQSLSENLFNLPAFVEGGGAWLTAEELAGFGLNKVMASFPAP